MRGIRLARPAACALVLVALAGCSQFTVRSDYDRAASFTGLRTYDWQPGPKRDIGDPRIDSRLLDSSVRNAVDRELATKGYAKASSGTPDFLVDYRAVEKGKSDMVSMPRWYGSAGVFVTGPSDTYTYHYDEGTLLVDVIDPKTMQPVWRGSATGIIDPTARPEKRDQRINQAIQQILKKFPPR